MGKWPLTGVEKGSPTWLILRVERIKSHSRWFTVELLVAGPYSLRRKSHWHDSNCQTTGTSAGRSLLKVDCTIILGKKEVSTSYHMIWLLLPTVACVETVGKLSSV